MPIESPPENLNTIPNSQSGFGDEIVRTTEFGGILFPDPLRRRYKQNLLENITKNFTKSAVKSDSEAVHTGRHARTSFEKGLSHLMESETEPRQRAKFQTTRWSLVLRAGSLESSDAQQAWNDLIERYWYPLYAFCRQQGSASHDAQDLTQGFFAHLLDRHALDSVAENKGRFRTFLLAAFKNYIVNQYRADHALKRGGSVTIHSLDHSDLAARFAQEKTTAETPEQAFDRRWVESLLDQVWRRLRNEYGTALKLPLFEQLQPHLTNDLQALPYAEVGRNLKISPAAVAMSIHRMRRRYGELLYEEVAATVDDPNDAEDELRKLMSIVSQSS